MVVCHGWRYLSFVVPETQMAMFKTGRHKQ
jgi:hypothetical protein